MSRPNKKDNIEENLKKIEEWTAQGLTMKQIAHNLNISVSTLYKYKKESVKFSDTVKKGREKSVKILENSMFEAAVGYNYKHKVPVKTKHVEYNPENGKKLREWEEVVEVEVVEHVPANTTAGIFLLKNWGKYSNEPATVEIREKELELREKQVEAAIW